VRFTGLAAALIVVGVTTGRGQDSATSRALPDSVRSHIARASRDPANLAIPSVDSFVRGPVTIAAGSTHAGSLAVGGGPLYVSGTIQGNAIAVDGDIVVRDGGHITGDAIAAFGKVRLEGTTGKIDGEARSLSGQIGRVTVAGENRTTSPQAETKHSVALALGWLVVLVLIGLGVLVFAGNYLDGVGDALEANFARSLLVGIGSQLAFVPVLAVLVIALALTIIGALLIPFAIVAYVLATVGLITLGFLAVARITGETVATGATRRLSARGAALRAMVVGVTLYLGVWVLAAAFTWAPLVSFALHAIAIAITWVAASAGLGATVLSRAGTRRAALVPASEEESNSAEWQTPTPIGGVVAARRPTPVSASRSRR
jgi:hypothetical protein